jgi:hypothetical protein
MFQGSRRIATFVVALCALGVQANAQVLYGSITGQVQDPSHAPIPGAVVTITHMQTGQSREAAANDAGVYSFPSVPSGTYEVKISREGFKPYVQRNVDVTINNVSRVDVHLELGNVTETVTVEASAAALRTDRSEVRAEVNTRALENLPVPPGRNYQQLLRTIPGFTQPRNAHSIPSNPSRSLQYEVNGTVSASNNVRMDGATQYNIWLPHITAYVPAIESIETVNVVTNSFDAEQGLAGGAAINVQIKSGTNDMHGVLFHYHNNNKLKAKPFFSPQGERNPKLVFNQFGGTLGGPIVRNKLFYFLSYEGTLDREFKSNLYTVPTALMRQGIMTESPNEIYDPLTGDAAGRGRTPFANKTIPAERISSVSRKLIDLMPAPTFPDRFTNNYYGAAAFSFDRHTVDSKVNWMMTDKLSAYGRYSYLKFDTFNARALGDIGGPPIAGGNPGNGFGSTHSGTWSMTYVAAPTFVLDGNIGVTLMDANSVQPRIDENLGRDFLGLPGTNGTRAFEGGWPRFEVSSFTVFGESETYMPYYRYDPQHNYQANANWLRGKHDVRFGTELSYQNLNHTQPEFYGVSNIAASGGFVFGNGPTQLNGGPSGNQWNSFSTFLLGQPTLRGRLLQVPDEYNTRTSMYSIYLRDRWQVTQNLTVNLGTRWEYFPMPVRPDRGLELYDMAANKMLVCGIGNVPRDCGVNMSKKLFAPRVGFAWRATDTFVIRAGYGITNDPWNLARPMRVNHPVLISHVEEGPNSFTPVGPFEQGITSVPVPELGNGVIDVPRTVEVNTLETDFRRGYIQSWNFTLEKQIGSWTASGGYVATRSNNVMGFLEQNYGFPGGGQASQVLTQQFGRTASTRLVGPVGNSHYDALQTKLDRRFSAGYQMQVAYTFSKCTGIAGVGNSGDEPSIKIPQYFHLNRSLCGQDKPHDFTVSSVAELPFGRGRHWATDGVSSAILGGWQVVTLFSAFSGNPFSVSSSGTSLNAPRNSQRADQVKPEVKKLGGAGPGQAFYDWTAFAPVTGARFGTAGFNTLRGPGLVNLDLGVFRRFAFGERVNLEFRAEAFNATNTPHFSNPSGNISNLRTNPDGSFRSGVFEVTSVRNTGREGIDERTFRFGLRFSF